MGSSAVSLEDQEAILQAMAQMGPGDIALVMTDEETEMLREFRRFKQTLKRDGKVFTWQTRRG